MQVQIRTSMMFREIFGNWRFSVTLPDKSTFGRLLERLVDTYGSELTPHLFEPDGTTLLSHVMFMVNGRNIRFLNHRQTILEDGDEVLILPPVGGG
ncbi:ThiS-like protein [Desulfosarcina variabilis str. Montpellier]|uniref:MoaD family protein n=1 Tax=Desulfosarcina variabilis TaxID=2300 RepID=UPI003AFB7EB7